VHNPRSTTDALTSDDQDGTSGRILFGVVVLAVLAMTASLLAQLETSAQEREESVTPRRLVARVGFETGLKSWEASNGKTRLDHVRGGHGGSKFAARIRGPKGEQATIGLTDSPGMVRNTSRGQVYRARMWLKANSRTVGPGVVGARIHLVEKGSSGAHVSTWRRVRLTNTKWHQVTVWLTARADGHHLDVSAQAFDVRAGGAVRVDNVTVHRVAAPKVADSMLRGTRFGASVDNGTKDWTRAFRQSDRRFGGLDVVRVYDPQLPGSWSGRLDALNRPFVYSFRATPSAVVDGRFDNEIRAWFRQAPTRWPIWWSYQHEPEDDIERGEYGATRYRQAWRHINQIAQSVDNRRLHPTLILMCWTLSSSSGRSFSDYYPGDFIEVLAWDCYNSSSLATRYKPPGEIFFRAVRKCKALDKKFGVAEVGSRLLPGDDGSRRAQWLVDIARYTAKHDAEFVSYWDARVPAGNFQLRDLPSRRAWRSVVN
jgi:hypothetical protein